MKRYSVIIEVTIRVDASSMEKAAWKGVRELRDALKGKDFDIEMVEWVSIENSSK